MQCVVLKSFPGPGGMPFLPGELVDASTFRLRDKLIEQRRMRPATPKEIAQAVEVDEAGHVSSAPLKARKRNRRT